MSAPSLLERVRVLLRLEVKVTGEKPLASAVSAIDSQVTRARRRVPVDAPEESLKRAREGQ